MAPYQIQNNAWSGRKDVPSPQGEETFFFVFHILMDEHNNATLHEDTFKQGQN